LSEEKRRPLDKRNRDRRFNQSKAKNMFYLRQKKSIATTGCALLLGVGFPLAAFSADAGSPEAKLKESLRAAMIQARTLQVQKEQVEAAKVDAEQKNEALTAELEALKAKATEDGEKAAKEIADLKKRGELQAASIAELHAA
jgi:hypothetical protein